MFISRLQVLGGYASELAWVLPTLPTRCVAKGSGSIAASSTCRAKQQHDEQGQAAGDLMLMAAFLVGGLNLA
ncbi:hypothetical protein WJX74_007716 [Apatococcus lobatus]|uniref:Uncharacterized protein n=1 Tax=Apatococcus lobatus TaxID=904363 RepID=A0AAW1QXQ0_9CHLO